MKNFETYTSTSKVTANWVTVNEGKVTGEYKSRDLARAAKTGKVVKTSDATFVVHVAKVKQEKTTKSTREYVKSTVENPVEYAAKVFMAKCFTTDETGKVVKNKAVKVKDVKNALVSEGVRDGTARLGYGVAKRLLGYTK